MTGQQRIITIEYRDILLRDEIRQDRGDFGRWFSEGTEWQEWNAIPSEMWEERKRRWERAKDYIENRLLEMAVPRARLEICHVDGTHIGIVSSHLMLVPTEGLSLGICIAESLYWGRGLGTQAFVAWIHYLFDSTGLTELYCDTAAGNVRMVRVAEKCGFREHSRAAPVELANGDHYTHVTFRLEREVFLRLHPNILDEITVRTRPVARK